MNKGKTYTMKLSRPMVIRIVSALETQRTILYQDYLVSGDEQAKRCADDMDFMIEEIYRQRIQQGI